MKCNLAGNATTGNTFAWGFDSSVNPSVTGRVSGQDIGETKNDSMGQIMTVAGSGTYTVTDDSTPGYSTVSSGTTGVTLLRLKFSATTENVDLKRVALQIGGVAASNTPTDLVGRKVTLYDSANPSVSIGEAIFSTTRFATSTVLTGFTIPAGQSKVLLVKGDIAAITASVGPLTSSGDLMRMAYDGDSNGIANGNYGVGVASGQNITPSSGDVTATGVRIYKAYPTFAKIDLSSSERLLQTASGRTLYKFSVTANGNDVYMYKFTFNIGSSTVSATTSVYGLYAFTDSGFSSADTTFSTDGLLNAGNCVNGVNSTDPNFNIVEVYMDSTACATATTTYKVPLGQTRYFKFQGNVAMVEAGTGTEFITVQLDGDAAYPSNSANLMNIASTINSDTHNDFVWSPNSTSTSISINDFDFTNGYGLIGLPTTNMLSETLTSAN